MVSIVVEDQDRPGLELDLAALVREGAWRMLVMALKAEVDAYVAAHPEERDAGGPRAGGSQRRGAVAQGDDGGPRAGDRGAAGERPAGGQPVHGKILPAWARRSPKVTEVLPVLYLRGISSRSSLKTRGTPRDHRR